jgi:hypothetical protein
VDIIPLHPINSNIGSPTYPLSKYLAKLLKTFCAKNEFSIDNGKEFADFVKSQTLGTDETIVSFDVVNLFTSIPVPLALNIVQKKLKETDSWKSHTALQEEQDVKLLKFLLSNCYFKFNETHYHQKSGCAMRSPLSAVIAEIVMQEIESIVSHKYAGGEGMLPTPIHVYAKMTLNISTPT